MNDFLVQHSEQVWLVAILLALGYLAHRVFGGRRAITGDRVPIRVYCKHCNWEGTVTRAAMACGRCRSTNLAVLAV